MRLKALWIAAAALLGVSSVLGQAQDSSQPGEKQIAAVFDGLATDKTPGLAVLVKKNGRVVFERGYGVKELKTGSRIDSKTDFRLASVTKQFTAMAIMLLVHDKKLSYETTLGEVFREFPEYGRKITVRQLLNHTGGLPDYEDLMEAREKEKGPMWSPEKQIQDAEVLQLLEKATRAKFAPGTKWDYSNSGYVVLGLIVANVSGKTYGDFLHERIFAPLKMADTLVYQKGKNSVPNRAYGHSKEKDAFKETDQSSTSATLGDGGVYSSVEDLSKWDDALRKHTLLNEEEMKPALTPGKYGSSTLPGDAPASLHGVKVEYGFGWFLDPYKGHKRMWHYGDTTGFKTAIQRFTKDGLTVIVLCNRTDLDPGALAERIIDLYE
ncbi:MAG: beta-lactamase family protein [Acidobacteria bacterium]|nr:beta-lactamase family protein [Acidobacteriota bacterium]MBS1864279.1 beta-lactamase family protein [Acidobacteriota bacterium]